jgi:VTC domain
LTYHNRHECKFVVPETVAGAVLARAAAFVEPDPNARRRPDHSYPIASLYLDSPAHALQQETIDGRSERYKLRVRSYSDAPEQPVFLEIKSRADRIVHKQRCPLPRHLLSPLLRGQVHDLPGLRHPERQTLDEFVRRMILRRAQPTCTVRYERQAYMGRGDGEVRVTVDRQLMAIPEREAVLSLQDPRYRPVPLAGVVIELKFTDRCPNWLGDIIRSLDLRRRSFSKYSTCVAALSHPTRTTSP